MTILAIESSCDDTSVALLSTTNDGQLLIDTILTASQIDIHKQYGGVVPEVAGREHAKTIIPLITEAIGGLVPDAIAVTSGPGLITGLLVGVEAAKNLAYLWDIPLIPVNHIEGHIYSVFLRATKESFDVALDFPALSLVVSGGHTHLIQMDAHGSYALLGKTRDDAAGETFDKVAKMIGIPYPGGPQVSKLAAEGNPQAIPLPRPMIKDVSLDMSFAGLKTAALYWLQDHAENTDTGFVLDAQVKRDFCASVEQAIVDVLVTKTQKAANISGAKHIILAGGVSANPKLRETLSEKIDLPVLKPERAYTMDNAAMIALAGYMKWQRTEQKELFSWQHIQADPNWKIWA